MTLKNGGTYRIHRAPSQPDLSSGASDGKNRRGFRRAESDLRDTVIEYRDKSTAK